MTNPTTKTTNATTVIEQTLIMHKLINLKALRECTGLSTSTIYDMLDPKSKRYDKTFPKQVKITANRVGWVAAEVNAWIESKIKARDEEVAA